MYPNVKSVRKTIILIAILMVAITACVLQSAHGIRDALDYNHPSNTTSLALPVFQDLRGAMTSIVSDLRLMHESATV